MGKLGTKLGDNPVAAAATIGMMAIAAGGASGAMEYNKLKKDEDACKNCDTHPDSQACLDIKNQSCKTDSKSFAEADSRSNIRNNRCMAKSSDPLIFSSDMSPCE